MTKSSIVCCTAAAIMVGACMHWWFWHPPGNSHESVSTQTAGNMDADPGDSVESGYWLHPKVQIIVAESSIMSMKREALRALPRNLAPHDLLALMQFIGRDSEELRNPGWHALVDAIINSIRCQDNFPVGLDDCLIRLYRSSDDVVIKGYALQYLWSIYMERRDFYKDGGNQPTNEEILVTLVEAAGQTEQSYSGTALMALHAIISSQGLKKDNQASTQIERHIKDIDSVFIRAATDSKTNKHSRISALQLCAMRGLTNILPVARALSVDPSTDPSIRISAIAVIGQLGSIAEDGGWLAELGKQELRLSHAAIPAIKKLRQKEIQ